jgi:hypothetical protein
MAILTERFFNVFVSAESGFCEPTSKDLWW